MRFASDNAGPVHPRVMEALAAANEGWALPYGNDDVTKSAVEKVRDVFEAPDAAVYFVATGTACNALLLATMADPFQTIFCTDVAHVEEDECNAPEFFTGGAKLTLIDAPHAKMDPNCLRAALDKRAGKNVHAARKGPLTLTQVTERGTLYSLNELADLTQIAKAHDVPVHLDGARFANAIAALGCTPTEISHELGIDAVSFGGTKNGCMGVEAAVIFNPELAWEFELRRKRAGHLFSKNRYLAAQMLAYLTDDLWLQMAKAANRKAQALAGALEEIDGVEFIHPPEANMLFVTLPEAAHERLEAAGAQYYPSPTGSARLVVDWSCPEEHIHEFVRVVRG
ncbi:MAG: aminotransferase class I/II-fold pyridoxal phosphate-dependent enzyme [Paracoccaceae bacterium]|nr:aminotransferase class I/II-fold pyridoxal phosphate-dependent enzyme [Paracoccaceae bacterium]